MQLTTQMKAEMDTIQERADHIIQSLFKVCSKCFVKVSEMKEFFDASIREVTIYKVRLENLLCETDIKEQDH